MNAVRRQELAALEREGIALAKAVLAVQNEGQARLSALMNQGTEESAAVLAGYFRTLIRDWHPDQDARQIAGLLLEQFADQGLVRASPALLEALLERIGP